MSLLPQKEEKNRTEKSRAKREKDREKKREKDREKRREQDMRKEKRKGQSRAPQRIMRSWWVSFLQISQPGALKKRASSRFVCSLVTLPPENWRFTSM